MQVDLKKEWDACSVTYGLDGPTYEQWYGWCLELLRCERKPQEKRITPLNFPPKG